MMFVEKGKHLMVKQVQATLRFKLTGLLLLYTIILGDRIKLTEIIQFSVLKATKSYILFLFFFWQLPFF